MVSSVIELSDLCLSPSVEDLGDLLAEMEYSIYNRLVSNPLKMYKHCVFVSVDQALYVYRLESQTTQTR